MLSMIIKMGNMGTVCLRILQGQRAHEERMLACLRLMKKVFVSQLITLAV
jgi:hypothetical protein